ncbi:hypothetical protein UC8_19540 [Roseimaritima ulvae]|uniref:Uncharacterized protein n=1 Tax=Roseimaritima ulvae TaxID=980254 RepID=A0A5B9R184_9BACT|nr:hypothetical protein UC8_19540 [Roseimaritima ulvae]
MRWLAPQNQPTIAGDAIDQTHTRIFHCWQKQFPNPCKQKDLGPVHRERAGQKRACPRSRHDKSAYFLSSGALRKNQVSMLAVSEIASKIVFLLRPGTAGVRGPRIGLRRRPARPLTPAGVRNTEKTQSTEAGDKDSAVGSRNAAERAAPTAHQEGSSRAFFPAPQDG